MAKPDPAGGPDAGTSPIPARPDSAAGAAQEATREEQANPAMEALLGELWSAWTQQHGALSLARLCKRTSLRMSTLKRCLTELEASEVATISTNARGVECASLTEAAASLAAAETNASGIQDIPSE